MSTGRPSLSIDTARAASAGHSKGGSRAIAEQERRERLQLERETRHRVRLAQQREQEREMQQQRGEMAIERDSIDSITNDDEGEDEITMIDNNNNSNAANTAMTSANANDASMSTSMSMSNHDLMHEDEDEQQLMQMQHEHRLHNDGEEDEEQGDEEQEDDEDDEDDDDELSSSPSIPDEHIDFDLVYALHTFLATVEGQASVVKGDQLTLLDDTNSYWWLVRVLKTQAVGYIPAENIETPFERLARLNKHRNVGITFATDQDMATGEGSSLAQTRFAQPHHPLNKSLQTTASRPPVQLNPALAGGGRFVDFAPPTYHEHEGPYYTDESGDSEGEYDDPEGAEEGAEDDEDDQGSNDSFEGGSLEEHNAMHREQMQIQQHLQAQGIMYNEGDAYGGAAIAPMGSAEGEEMDDDRRYHARQAQQLRAQQRSVDDNEITEEPAIAQGKLGQQQQQAGIVQPTVAGADQRNPLQPLSRATQASAQAALGVAGGQRPGASSHAQQVISPQIAVTSAGDGDQQSLKRKISVDEQLRAEQEASATSPPRLRNQATASPYAGGQDMVQQNSNASTSSSRSNASASRLKPFTSDAVEGRAQHTGSPDSGAETRKISLTPKIARDDSADSNLSDRAMSPNAPTQQRQPLRQTSNSSLGTAGKQSADQQSVKSNASMSSQPQQQPRDMMAPTMLEEDFTHYRRGSAGSASSSGSKRSGAASPANGESASGNVAPKKKKSGGILGGLFSRKKDKGESGSSSKESKKAAKGEGSRKVSGASSSTAGTVSDDDRASTTSSPAPDSPEKNSSRQSPQPGQQQQQPTVGIVSQQLQQRRAKEQAQEEMFGTTAALRQQQVEAQNAMYHNYGIHPRAAGDTVNTSSFAASGSRGQSDANQHLQAANMTLSPSSASAHSSLSGSAGPGAQRLRPGSLIGSPHMPGTTVGGAEAPTLNVLRVFAGENVVAEATFKTVLLNESTTTEDLVKQAMQRFRLAPPASATGKNPLEAIMQEYYLTAKEVSGDETLLEPGQKPLKIFEDLSEAAGMLSPGQGLPSVKRSSVGSINSIASNLSLNPAIEKLRMSDFGDDSTVKLFINKRTPDTKSIFAPAGGKRASSDSTSTIGKRTSDELARGDPNRLSATGSIVDKGPAPGMPSSPLLRFAVRILIHPADLPDSMVFDPISAAIIPKTALAERQQQAMSRSISSASIQGVSPEYREKIIFFPRNANVSEVLETALDRFGIVEGVVDGGDVVEDRMSRRRSMSRVRYTLMSAAVQTGRQETNLAPSAKLLDAYEQAPIFKHYDRNSKEYRRRSMDAAYNTPSGADLQSSDPTFVIRRAGYRPPIDRNASSETVRDGQLRPDMGDRAASAISTSTSARSLYSTPMTELPPNLERALSPQQSTQDIIAAQRAASRANQQKTMYSAQKNSHHGVDVLLEDKSRIRSSKDSSNTMRYSYVGVDGSELDISEIVEKEWRAGGSKSSQQPEPERSDSATPVPIPARDTPSALSYTTNDSFASALASPMMSSTGSAPSRSIAGDDEEELRAIQDLATTPMSIDRTRDHLQDALNRRAASPALSTSSQQGGDQIHDRLDRVLARVKAGGGTGGVAGGIASALRNQTVSPSPSTSSARYIGGKDGLSRSDSALSNASPRSVAADKPSYIAQALRARSGSNTSSGRASPAPVGGRITPQQNLESHPGSGGSTPKGGAAGPSAGAQSTPLQKQASGLSDGTSSDRTGSPSTPATTSAGNATLTPVSSTRNESRLGRIPIPYRADFGLDFLMSLVDLDTPEPPPLRPKELSVEEALGPIPFPNVSQEVAGWYEQPRKKLDEMDARLDRLLEQVLASSA